MEFQFGKHFRLDHAEFDDAFGFHTAPHQKGGIGDFRACPSALDFLSEYYELDRLLNGRVYSVTAYPVRSNS